MPSPIHHIAKALLPDFVWHGPATDQTVYLTFDDGPTPGVTDVILNMLAAHQAKATFFCLGRQVDKHPDLFKRIMAEGHTIGNHSYSHPDGLAATPSFYLKDVANGLAAIEKAGGQTRLFRPPYGRINPLTISKLKQQYQIVMWDNLPQDYDTSLSPDKVLANALQQLSPGNIIVLHDSAKAANNVTQVLPLLLKHLSAKSYKFASLSYLNV